LTEIPVGLLDIGVSNGLGDLLRFGKLLTSKPEKKGMDCLLQCALWAIAWNSEVGTRIGVDRVGTARTTKDM
jgi:hypothetical protein